MFGILGNNARNLLYIKKFNNKKAIRLANNKLETKNFLSERGIPFAKTYGIISNRNELYDFDFSYLPKKTFVVKPNQGSKGNGILIVKNISKDSKNNEEKKTNILTHIENRRSKIVPYTTIPTNKAEKYHIGNSELTDETFRRYLLDIIDGKYSMTMGNDKVIIEEKLIPGELFKDFCEFGLADIRVIVFNLVPIATMIRVPTKYSNGKANLAQGGLGLGIEVGTGNITSMLRKNKIYTKKFPKEFEHFYGKKIPYRNDILFLSSKAQYFVNLGYLALDRVITNEGPKLLEINARAGLEVQKVTNTPLEKILGKIEDINIQDPEKGVEIAKTLFSKESNDFIKQQKILYLSQYGKLIFKGQSDDSKIDVVIEVNLNKQNNYTSQNIYEKTKQKSDFLLDMYDNDIIIKKIKLLPAEQIGDNKIILGKKTAELFLIKAIHKTFERIEIISPESTLPTETKELHIIDEKIEKLSKKLNLSSKLRPINYFNELDNFITRHGNYNPIFKYKRPKQEKLLETKDNIKKIIDRINKLESPIKQLFLEKVDELTNKLLLIDGYTKQDFKSIAKYNEKLFDAFDEKLLKTSKEKVFSQKDNNQNILGEALKLSEIDVLIERYLAEKKIFGVDIVFSYNNLSRISVIMGKEIKISVSKHGIFREKEILSILAHEIDTHLVRYLNGLKSGRNIFKSGTGYYLKDEEGLAIWNAHKFLPEEYEKDSIYKKYYLTNEATKLSFKKLIDIINFMYPNRSNEQKFKTALRIKKGIINTNISGIGTCFTKDKLYLDGFEKINKEIKEGKSLEMMYKGKLKIEDLGFII